MNTGFRAISGALLCGGLAFPAGAGDAPGAIVWSGASHAPALRAIPHALRARSIGTFTRALNFSLGNPIRFPVAVIAEDGRPRMFFDPEVTPPAAFPPVPAAAFDLAEIHHLSPDGARSWFVARRADGALVQWAEGFEPYAPPPTSWQRIAAGKGNVAGVAADGTVVAWNEAGPLLVAGAPASPIDLSLASGWGVAVDARGTLRAMSMSALGAPAVPAASGLRAARVLPFVPATVAAPIVIVMRADGSLERLGTGSSVPGPYESMAYSQAGVVALTPAGNVDVWTLANFGIPAARLPGVYRSVHALHACAAIWSDDTDRNGEPDRAQILRGDMPDANGDIIDDRLQGKAQLTDFDANGVMDCVETSAYVHASPSAEAVDGSGLVLGIAGPLPGWHGVMLTLARVRPGAETVSRLSLPTGTWSDPAGAFSEGVPAMLHVWSDPDEDGDPADAQLIAERGVMIKGSRSFICDFEPIKLGAPGTPFFFGISYEVPAGTQSRRAWPFINRATPTVSTSEDIAGASRRARIQYWAMAPLGTAASATDLVRGPVPGGSRGWTVSEYDVQSLPRAALLPPGPGPATDCDRDGVLDALDLALGAAATDTNANGELDSCERAAGDLDLDGRVDGRDLGRLLAAWGRAVNAYADLNTDGQVDGQDLAVILGFWR